VFAWSLLSEMTCHAPREGRLGRPAVFPNAAIQVCPSIKVLLKLPLGQTAVRRARRCRSPVAVPLNLLMDSTGIRFLGDGEWRARKHGVQGRRARHCRSDRWRSNGSPPAASPRKTTSASFAASLGQVAFSCSAMNRVNPLGTAGIVRGA